MRAALGGWSTGRLELSRVDPDILLAATRPTDPRLLPVRDDGGRVVPRGALVEIEARRLEPPTRRVDGRPSRRLTVEGGAKRPSPEALAGLLAAVPRGAGDAVVLSGRARELGEAFAQLRFALGLALVLMLLTVAALYESLTLPWVVLTTVPTAAAGAAFALALGGGAFDVMAFLGLILLAGIVVNNALVLVHRAEQRWRDGEPPSLAVRGAAAERYRPIVMTTLTTLLGMLPLALLGGEGVALRRSLALAVIGGSITALAGSLLVVPVLYRRVVRREARA